MKEKGSEDPDGVLHDEEGDRKHEHLQDPEASEPGRQGEPRSREGKHQKVLTYVEYRAVSGVFQNIDPPPLPSPPSECVLPPAPKAGDTHSPGGDWWGGWGVNILEDARNTIGLLQYNLSTVSTIG